MNVIAMMHEIHLVANPVIRESSLPHLPLSTDDTAEFVRIRAFDQLNSPLNRYVHGGSQQEMRMVGHDNKHMQLVSPIAAMPIERLQEKLHVRFDHKQPAAIPSREGYEVSSGRGNESSRLQGQTSAAESRASLPTLNWHEWNSCPSRLFLSGPFSVWEKRSFSSEIENNG
jgi:hypothetical protein